jgi:hypothetical protein
MWFNNNMPSTESPASLSYCWAAFCDVMTLKGTGGAGHGGGAWSTGLIFEESTPSTTSGGGGVGGGGGGGVTNAKDGAHAVAAWGAGDGGAPTDAADTGAAPAPEDKHHRTAATSILYPGDLLPLTRKPLCLVVDSESAAGFDQVTSQFGMPVICLLSPMATPPAYMVPKSGSVFSYFLHAPLEAFVFVSLYGARFAAEIYTRRCHWLPRLLT